MRRRPLLATLVASAAFLMACQLIIGIEEETGAGRPHEAGAPAGSATTTPTPTPKDDCPLVKAPAWPDAGGVADAANIETTLFAVRNFVVRPFGEPAMGFDLDDRCTNLPGARLPAPCVNPTGLDASDDDGGIDNGFGRLIGAFPSSEQDPAARALDQQVSRGNFTLLLEVSQWNGTDDDDKIVIELYAGYYNDRSKCDPPEPPPPDGGADPVWDGCDHWGFPGKFELGIPLQGHVTHGVVVATPTLNQDIVFRLVAGSMHLSDGVLTARVGADGDGGRALTDGVIAGRMALENLLPLTGNFTYLVEGRCEKVALFHGLVCAARDTIARRADDGKGLACDALSFAVGFKLAMVVSRGESYPVPLEARCPPVDASCP